MMADNAQTGKGAPSGAPNPYRQSCLEAADTLLQQFKHDVAGYLFDQRLRGAAQHHEAVAGLLTEHALALDETLNLMLEALARDCDVHVLRRAINQLRTEVTYIRSYTAGGEQ